MSGTLCGVCGAKTDGFVCKTCARELDDALAEMPRDLSDLQAVATRQAIGPLGLGDPGRMGERVGDKDPWFIVGDFEDGSLGDSPWDFAPGAADQIWAATNTLGTWVRHLAESRQIDLPIAERGRWERHRRVLIERNRWLIHRWREFTPDPEQPIGTVIRWLRDNLQSIRMDEAAVLIHDEIIALHAENLRWSLGRGGDEVFAGNCDATQVGFEQDETGALVPVAAYCGVALYGHESEEKVRCTACGTRYALQPRLEEIRNAQINDRLARAHLIADALTTLEEPLGRDLLRKWIQRDVDRPPAQHGPACERCIHPTCRSIRRPPILAQSIDEDGHPLYRFGDVRRRLQAVQEQRGAKLTA